MDRAAATNWNDWPVGQANHNFVLFFIFAFGVGIFISSFYFVSPLISSLLVLVALAILVAEKVSKREIKKEIVTLSLILLALGLGSLRYAVKDFHEIKTPAEVGVVVSEPEDRDNSRRFVLLSDNGEKVLVSTPLYTRVEYGDRVKVSGKLERPGVIESDAGRPFDYGKYLAKDDIYHTLSFTEVAVLSSGHGNWVKSTLFKIKENFIDQARNILAEPYAGLLLGLIVAGRDALPTDILEGFRRAGVVHIVVLSGFNITLIAEFLRRVFKSFFVMVQWSKWPQAPAIFSIIGVALFVIMTGGEATVVRAALMSLTVIMAGFFGRKYSASRALLFAGFLMLLENPKILVFDPSFQLSFLATLGLIYFSPPIERKFTWLSNRFKLRENLTQTLSTQLAVLPALIYMMGDISLVAIPANLLILTTVPYAMFFGFLSVLAAFFSAILAWPLAFVTHLILSWILFIAQTFGSLFFATLSIPHVSIWMIVLLYLAVITFVLMPKLSTYLVVMRRSRGEII